MGGVETANLAAEEVSNRDNVGGGGDLYTTGSLTCLGDKARFGEPVVMVDTWRSVILVVEVASAGTPVEFADKGALATILGLWWGNETMDESDKGARRTHSILQVPPQLWATEA